MIRETDKVQYYHQNPLEAYLNTGDISIMTLIIPTNTNLSKIFSFSTSQRGDCDRVKELSFYQKIQGRFVYTLL